MKKCKICKTELNNKTLGIDKMLNKSESKRLKKIRLKNGVCSECSIQMLMLSIKPENIR